MIHQLRRGLALSLCICWILFGLSAGSTPNQDVQEAQKAFQAKDYDKVIALLSPYVEKLNRSAMYLLAESYSQKGNSTSAVKIYQTIVAQNPKDYETKRNIGVEYLKMKKLPEAMVVLREAIDINPRYEPAYLDIAKIYETKGNRYELRLLYEDLIAKVGKEAPSYPTYIDRLCELTTLDAQYALSEKYCAEGILRDPREAKNRVYMAMRFKYTGDIPKAAKEFTVAAESSSKSEFAQISAAEFFVGQKNSLKAYYFYKRATVAEPQSFKGWYGLGTTSADIQKYDEALNAFTKACALDKKALVEVRRTAAALQKQKSLKWAPKFESLADTCGMDAPE